MKQPLSEEGGAVGKYDCGVKFGVGFTFRQYFLPRSVKAMLFTGYNVGLRANELTRLKLTHTYGHLEEGKYKAGGYCLNRQFKNATLVG